MAREASRAQLYTPFTSRTAWGTDWLKPGVRDGVGVARGGRVAVEHLTHCGRGSEGGTAVAGPIG